MPWSFDNNRSIYAQIVEEIQNRIANGQYEPGSRLPAVRELAEEAGVNPNTMQKALAELERMELVFSRRTSGRFVTEDDEKIMEMRRKSAREAVDAFLQQMENMGIKKEEIIRLIKEEEEKFII